MLFASVLTLSAARLAHGDVTSPAARAEANALVKEGEEMAKAGRFTHAVERFKQADAKRPRAAHACFIGLAYLRHEALAQAELFFERCEERAAPSDAPPAWLPKAKSELKRKIAEGNVPSVTFSVTTTASVRLIIVGWPADETFAPRGLPLPAGRYVLEATGDGLPSKRQEFTVGSAPMKVLIDTTPPPLAPSPPAVETPTTPSQVSTKPKAGPPVSPPNRRRTWGLVVGAVGLASAAGGGVAHVLAALDRSKMLVSEEEWDRHKASFTTKRTVAISGYSLGAALLSTAAYLYFSGETPPVGVSAALGGGGVVVTWELISP